MLNRHAASDNQLAAANHHGIVCWTAGAHAVAPVDYFVLVARQLEAQAHLLVAHGSYVCQALLACAGRASGVSASGPTMFGMCDKQGRNAPIGCAMTRDMFASFAYSSCTSRYPQSSSLHLASLATIRRFDRRESLPVVAACKPDADACVVTGGLFCGRHAPQSRRLASAPAA